MSQVPVVDNYYAALNSAVFSDGSFVFIPKGVKSPMEISTYFRINASETGQVGWGALLQYWALCVRGCNQRLMILCVCFWLQCVVCPSGYCVSCAQENGVPTCLNKVRQ